MARQNQEHEEECIQRAEQKRKAIQAAEDRETAAAAAAAHPPPPPEQPAVPSAAPSAVPFAPAASRGADSNPEARGVSNLQHFAATASVEETLRVSLDNERRHYDDMRQLMQAN